MEETKKKEQGLTDFSDLMVEFGNFLDTNQGKEFIKKIDYVFFDEYQDKFFSIFKGRRSKKIY